MKSGRRGCLGSRLGRIVDFETCLVYMRTAFLNDGMYHFHGQVVTVTWNPFPVWPLLPYFCCSELAPSGPKEARNTRWPSALLRSSAPRMNVCANAMQLVREGCARLPRCEAWPQTERARVQQLDPSRDHGS